MVIKRILTVRCICSTCHNHSLLSAYDFEMMACYLVDENSREFKQTRRNCTREQELDVFEVVFTK